MTESILRKSRIINTIEKNKIFAVVRTNNLQKTVNISKALIEGGIKVIEITMSFEGVEAAIQEISQIEDVSVAAGSVITSRQANNAIDAGARLIVSPVTEMGLIKVCKGRRTAIATGAATPTEAYNAWKYGVNIIKIFPAKALGGPDYIKDILTPMPFLHLMPTGGVNVDNFIDYLKAGAVAVGMGNAFYADESNFAVITQKAKKASQKLRDYLENEEISEF